MGKVDRLRNRVDPFAALFWALDLQIPDPAGPGITPQPYAWPYMVIVGAPFPIYCRYVIYLWSQQPTSCCWGYRDQLCNSAIAGQGAHEQWEAGGDTGELVDNGHAIYGCQFEEPGSVDVLSSAEDGRLVCAELGTRDKCRDILTLLQGKIDSYWRTIFFVF